MFTVQSMQQSAPHIKGSIRYLQITAHFNHTSLWVLPLSTFLKLIKKGPLSGSESKSRIEQETKVNPIIVTGILADRIPCRLFLIWLESALAAHLQTKLKHTAFCPQGKPRIRRAADSPRIGFVPLILYSLPAVCPCPGHISPQPFCGHAGTLYVRNPISKQLVSFRKLKLINTCCMNYITSPHMHSVLHKHTHLALVSVHTNGDSSPTNISVSASVSFLSVCGQTLVTLFASSSGSLFYPSWSDRRVGFTTTEFLIWGKVWITDGCVIFLLQTPFLVGLTFQTHLYCFWPIQICIYKYNVKKAFCLKGHEGNSVVRTFVFVISYEWSSVYTIYWSVP